MRRWFGSREHPLARSRFDEGAVVAVVVFVRFARDERAVVLVVRAGVGVQRVGPVSMPVAERTVDRTGLVRDERPVQELSLIHI